ncbi:hypothetical protein L2E82_17196 [Cichorium intybus]|uniref:Uncharacterized protein n=1 Tax=Cichorium intybus TaxID=13427 RepID=A0ACB9F849_CICIN|nr:hypothetical protein L2E82_17196 [Cichorium intybus]
MKMFLRIKILSVLNVSWRAILSPDYESGFLEQTTPETARIKKYEERIPQSQARIGQKIAKVADLQDCLDKKKAQSAIMMEGTSKARKRKGELEQKLSLATKERIELKQEYGRRRNNVVKMAKRIKLLEQQISDVSEQHMKDTQAKRIKLKKIEDDAAKKLANARDGLKEITSEEGSG